MLYITPEILKITLKIKKLSVPCTNTSKGGSDFTKNSSTFHGQQLLFQPSLSRPPRSEDMTFKKVGKNLAGRFCDSFDELRNQNMLNFSRSTQIIFFC